MRVMQACLLVALLWAVPSSPIRADDAAETTPAPILIDGIHANNFLDDGLRPGMFEYHRLHATRNGIEYLESRGIRYELIQSGRITPQRLTGRKLLFINLPSAERPSFLVSEIKAICDFVRGGGSLLSFVDHTNAYFHAYRLEPLYTELGMKIYTDGLCDVAPNTVGTGNGWVAATRFKKHPVTEGLRCIVQQTGGRVDPRFAVALSSPESWADHWQVGIYGEAESLGLFGNFERDEGEELGPHGLVAAREFGAGRIVVVADQNMLADVALNYADNYRLWLNSIAWLLRDASIRDVRAYQTWRRPRVMLYEQPSWATFGTRDADQYYNAAATIGRVWWTFTGERLEDPADLIVFAHNHCGVTDEAVAATVDHLKAGKNVLVLYSPGTLVWDEEGVVHKVLRALGEPEAERRERGGQLILTLSSGARIHVLGRDYVKFDNSYLPLPTVTPNEADEQLIAALLSAVRDALGD